MVISFDGSPWEVRIFGEEMLVDLTVRLVTVRLDEMTLEALHSA